MCERRARFDAYAEHPWLSRCYKRLAAHEKALAYEFIAKHQESDTGAFEHAVNRMFLDVAKPKNWAVLVELLTACNIAKR